MDKALRYFENIEDPRSIRNQKHAFMTQIGTSLLASLAGIDSFSGFADFTAAHFEGLKGYFDFPHGVPSHDTYQRFWDGIKPEAFYHSFGKFTQALATATSTLIHIDGKTIRNSGTSKPLHIVSACCQANQLTLAQKKVKSKAMKLQGVLSRGQLNVSGKDSKNCKKLASIFRHLFDTNSTLSPAFL